ncbi:MULTISPECIES: substrate-binding domain-containing protein [unclassified Streptomyces]|uniref:substrate-binding domain-containing protein n=1 Tax=unclassified Streptomyces TaxID=2593676 RepID=UPI00342C1C21
MAALSSRRGLALTGALATLLALSACTHTSATSTTGAKTKSGSAIGDGLNVVAVGGPLSDPFFGAIDKGAKAAADQLGASYDYSAPKDLTNFAADFSQLIDTAITKKPDVLVVGDFIPSAFDPKIKKAVDAGITVVLYNSGADSWKKVGAVGFVGENAAATGQAAGEGLNQAGVKHLVCVNHVPENPVLQTRCDGAIKGIKAAGGTGTTLTIPSSQSGDAQSVTQTIKGYLMSHKNVDGVFTLGVGIAADAESAVTSVGRPVKVGTTDLSIQVLNDVKAGKLQFAIDQQGWLQTYQAVSIGITDRVLGMHPVNSLDTSPLVITKDNADKVLKVQQKYGVRGAS